LHFTRNSLFVGGDALEEVKARREEVVKLSLSFHSLQVILKQLHGDGIDQIF